MSAHGLVPLADLPTGPDPVSTWMRVDFLTRRVIDLRKALGPSPGE